jgi:hypothetical protein
VGRVPYPQEKKSIQNQESRMNHRSTQPLSNSGLMLHKRRLPRGGSTELAVAGGFHGAEDGGVGDDGGR